MESFLSLCLDGYGTQCIMDCNFWVSIVLYHVWQCIFICVCTCLCVCVWAQVHVRILLCVIKWQAGVAEGSSSKLLSLEQTYYLTHSNRCTMTLASSPLVELVHNKKWQEIIWKHLCADSRQIELLHMHFLGWQLMLFHWPYLGQTVTRSQMSDSKGYQKKARFFCQTNQLTYSPY